MLRQIAERVSTFWASANRRFGPTGLILIGLVVATVIGFSISLNRTDTLREAGIAEQLDSGEALTIGQRIHYGTRVASFGIVCLGVILLATSPIWARRQKNEVSTSTQLSSTPIHRGTWVLILVAVVFAGFSRAPRLEHSLWNDEEVSLRKFVAGGHGKNSQSGELEFRAVDWKRTLFYSLSGNNHISQSVASRLGHDTWTKLTGAAPGDFSESAIRMGSFVAGLATIALLGLWLARQGHPVAGVTTAFVLAIHPWHSRYAVEARGYSLLLFFLVILFFCLAPALTSGRWKYWLGFGIAQAGAMLSFAASAFLLLPVNLIALAILVHRRDGTGLVRWIFTCAVSGAAVAYFLLPTILGSMGWLSSLNEIAAPNSWGQLREFLSHLMMGIHWQAGDPAFDFGIGILDLTQSSPLVSALVLIVLPLSLLVGSVIAWKRSQGARLLILSTLSALVIITLYREFSTTPFHVWYAVYAMIWFAVAMGFLAEGLMGAPQKEPSSPHGKTLLKTWGPAFTIILVYGILCRVPNERMRSHARHPMREAVETVHASAPLLHPSTEFSTIAIGSGAKQFQSYDPYVQTPNNLAEFHRLQAEANATDRNLVVYVTGPAGARQTYPDIFRELDDPDRFSEVALVKGIEAFWSIQIYQQTPASLQTRRPRSQPKSIARFAIGRDSDRSGVAP